MMRRTCMALALALIFGLCACGREAAPPTEVATAAVSTTTTTPPETTAAPMTVPAVRPPPPEEIITWVSYGISFYPVSYQVAGEERLMSDDGAEHGYVGLEDDFALVREAPQPKSLPQTNTSAMYVDGVVPALDAWRDIMLKRVASNGDWEFFPVKMRYEAYTPENQPENPQWLAYFSGLLLEESPQTPIIITEAWFFDWAGDGNESAVVSAGNTLRHEGKHWDIPAPKPPPTDGTVLYELSALFTAGNPPVPLSYTWFGHPHRQPLDDQDITEGYLPPREEADIQYGCYDIAIQWDAAGALMRCPVYKCSEGWNPERIAVLVCDIDGDGAAELLTLQTAPYAPIVIHKLMGGAPREVSRSYTGA